MLWICLQRHVLNVYQASFGVVEGFWTLVKCERALKYDVDIVWIVALNFKHLARPELLRSHKQEN